MTETTGIIAAAVDRIAGIDFLRGLAILLVLFFHFQVPGFGYAYLGVDLFFFISGFLMARLYSETPWREFYRRRARRILPAYFTVLVLTYAVVALIALPHEKADNQRYLVWAGALVPNVGFWTDASYFDNQFFRPFLHLWSLGVEVQFYLAFPLLALLYRRSRRALAMVAIGSFALWLWFSWLSPKTAFFMAPTRLWEFLIGFFLAKAGVTFSWPSSDPVSRTLARYSYAVYLVHFPVIVFLAYEPFGGTRLALNWTGIAEAIILTTILAGLLHHLVERPRQWRWALTGASLVALTGAHAPRLGNRQLLASEAWLDRGGYRCPVLARIVDPWSNSCPIAGRTGRRIILVGDSHADALKDQIGQEVAAKGGMLRLMRQNYALGRGYTIDEIMAERPSEVIVHSTAGHMDLAAVDRLSRRVPVILIMPVPMPGFNVPKRLFDGGGPTETARDYLDESARLIRDASKLKRVKILWPHRIMCRPVCRIATDDGRPLYYDDGHLTLTGAAMLRPLFRQISL